MTPLLDTLEGDRIQRCILHNLSEETLECVVWAHLDSHELWNAKHQRLPSHSRFYTLAGNPVKEILLKLNLLITSDPTDSKVTATKHGKLVKMEVYLILADSQDS
ncbi:hypothetical protein Tco_0117354 [Tanacetum coccineum]